MEPAGERFDAFVSYRQAEPDRSWVRTVLIPRLRTAGLAVCVDYQDFRLGLPLVLEMARAVESSRYCVAVFTPRYLESSFTQLETVLAEHLGIETAQYRLIGVLREPCPPRLGIRASLLLDVTRDELVPEQLDRLVETLRGPANPRS